ncbi:hypothetical protein CLF_108755 [Clonorchis sinensis]|uniref:C2H2-type domain-containing protein n=1 Tax=Clonorchis sinensis TaxID=79923 RepID=G7YRX3_CLOSI|nr:hypothetical protein CLF_108755 [Clonorchis sinensis]
MIDLKAGAPCCCHRGGAKILRRAISIQKANPTIRRLSGDRPLAARKLGHSSSREEAQKRLPDGAKLKAKPIVVIAPCAPESTQRQTTTTPDSNFYSTTADPSNAKGSDALEEASLTWTGRPKYVELLALLSITDDKGAAVNSTPESQLSWIGSDERSQVPKPTGKPTTCADVDIGELCENRTATETVKLPISSSTPSKVASLIVDTVVAQDLDSQSLKPDHSEPESPSYTQLVTLIAGFLIQNQDPARLPEPGQVKAGCKVWVPTTDFLVFFPLYDFHHVPVPNECPWNPHLDIYNLQELMKTQNSARDWQCNQCWKRFYSEHALDLHMDNRHRSTVYTGPNATCLALFCPLLRCDVLHPDLAFGDQVFWDEALCTESRFEELRVQCESSTPTESHVLLIFLAITGVIIYYVTVLMRISGPPNSIPASSLSSPYYFDALKATMQSREGNTHAQRHSASRFRRR